MIPNIYQVVSDNQDACGLAADINCKIKRQKRNVNFKILRRLTPVSRLLINGIIGHLLTLFEIQSILLLLYQNQILSAVLY